MDFGLAIFATDESVAPDVVAAMAEERGFESLFFTEHTHIPASRRTPYPVGGELPREYYRYHGAHVDFEAIYSWPKPVQDPHPPVLVGGNGRTVLDRVLAYGDAWYPNRFGDDDRFIARIETLQRRGREEAGRDRIPVTLQLAPTEPELLERYERAGVTRGLWYLPSGPADKVERALDRYAQAPAAAVAA